MNNPHNNTINFYLLAGGKSSRMGTDKGLLPMHGKFMIEYALEQIKPLAKGVFIVTNNVAYNKLHTQLVIDEIKDIGPAGGIYSALKHSDTAFNFITGCDMPFITTAAMEYIILQHNDYEITIPVFEGKAEPLLGLYSKKIADKWLHLLQQKNNKLQELVNHFKVQKINVASHPMFSKKLFMNINTPKDLEEANLL